jgi:hypothetical protein
VNAADVVAEREAGDAGEGSLFFLAALHDEARDHQARQHREEGEDHRGAGGVVSDIVRRAQLQELAEIVDHLAWPIGKAGEAAVSGSEQTPDKTKEKEGGDRVTRRDVPAQPPRRRDQLGDERNEYGADQEPVEQPCGQVPHPDRTRDVLGIRDRARSAIRIPH